MKLTISETRKVAKIEVIVEELNKELASWMTLSSYHLVQIVYEERQIIGHPDTLPVLRSKCFIRATADDEDTSDRNQLPRDVQIADTQEEEEPDTTQDMTKNEKFMARVIRKWESVKKSRKRDQDTQ